MDWKPAIVDWLSYEDGGRKVPPTGDEPPIYWSVVKFVNADAEPQANSWSLFVRKVTSDRDGYRWNALVRFRVNEAPYGMLVPEARFELYEGAKLVASGNVLANDPRTAGRNP